MRSWIKIKLHDFLQIEIVKNIEQLIVVVFEKLNKTADYNEFSYKIEHLIPISDTEDNFVDVLIWVDNFLLVCEIKTLLGFGETIRQLKRYVKYVDGNAIPVLIARESYRGFFEIFQKEGIVCVTFDELGIDYENVYWRFNEFKYIEENNEKYPKELLKFLIKGGDLSDEDISEIYEKIDRKSRESLEDLDDMIPKPKREEEKE